MILRCLANIPFEGKMRVVLDTEVGFELILDLETDGALRGF